MAITQTPSTTTTTSNTTHTNSRPSLSLRGGCATSHPSIYNPATDDDAIRHEYNRTEADWERERAELNGLRALWRALNTPEALQRRLGAWVPVMDFLLLSAAKVQEPWTASTMFVGMPGGYGFYVLQDEEEDDDGMYDYARVEDDSDEDSDEENHGCLHHGSGMGYRRDGGFGLRGG